MKRTCLLIVLYVAMFTFGGVVRSNVGARQQKLATSEHKPYDSEILYLQGQYRNNLTWIDTGVSLYDGDIEIVFQFPQHSINAGAFGYSVYGAWKGESVAGLVAGCSCFDYNNKVSFRYGAAQTLFYSVFDTDIHVFSTSLQRMFLDGEDLGISGRVTTYGEYIVDTIPLFCERNRGVVGVTSSARIYSFRCEGVIDLIPVRIGDEGYMYDLFSGKLLGNEGTGKFVLGPDK